MSTQYHHDHVKRQLVSEYEVKRLSYKVISETQSLPLSVRMKASHKLHRLNRNTSQGRVRNRCFLTGRSRGILRFCKLSRIEFRRLALRGALVGVRKSSW